MVPQLLPPVAATTIGTPTQSTGPQKPSSSGMCGGCCVYILFCAISLVAPPTPRSREGFETQHAFHALPTGHTLARDVCVCVCLYTRVRTQAGMHQVNRENQMSAQARELPGGGGRVRPAPSESGKQTMRFSPNTQAGGPRGVAI